MFVGLGDSPGKDFLQRRQDEILKNRGEITPGWTEKDLLKGLTQLYQLINRVTDQVERKEQLPCESGCSWCCENITVLLTEAEWMVVVNYLKAADPKVAWRVLRRSHIAYKKHKKTIDAISDQQERAEELAAKIRLPCPFLADDKTCSIYLARPHDCRLYGCSFKGEELNACHLVTDAVAGRPVTLPPHEQSSSMLSLYPLTEVRQTFGFWAKHFLPEALETLVKGPKPD